MNVKSQMNEGLNGGFKCWYENEMESKRRLISLNTAITWNDFVDLETASKLAKPNKVTHLF